PEYKVTRLNADGSVDRIFDSVVLARGDAKLLLQPDGRILICHSNIIAAGQNRGGLVRLNADGTLDTSFSPQGILVASAGVLQPDGKIIAGTLVYSPTLGSNIAVTVRFLPDGNKDQSFTPYGASLPSTIALQPDGKIILGYGLYLSAAMKRLNADGTPDTTFNTQFGANAIVIQADGKIIVGNSSGILRLNGDGSLDSDFPAQATYAGYRVHEMLRQPDDKILIGGNGWYYLSLSTLKKRLTRINPDGTQDTTFDAMTGDSFGYDSLNPLALRPDGRILVTGNLIQGSVRRDGLFSLHPNGTIDQTFTADLGYVPGSVSLVTRQPDGKILIAGFFARVNNFPTFGFARLNQDGTTDTSFSFSEQIANTTQGVNFVPVAVAFQTDGKILIGGNFRFNGQENYGVFRLNQNGSIDSSFTPQRFTFPPSYIYASVNALALQADGKILVGGGFQNYGNSGRNHLVRLNTDGSVDTAYTATSTGISKMLIQPGGKIVVSGTITENGVTKTNPRLNTDGTIDPTFNMPTDVGSLYAVAPDGRLATSGWFPYSKYSVNHVFRLNPDGSRDTSFSTPRSFDGVSDIAFQNDGQILVSRNYYIVRYDGTENVREIFRQSSNIGGMNLRTMLVTPDNKLVVGGIFANLAGARRTGIARFLLKSSDFDFDGDSLADFCVFRPSERNWYILRSTDGASTAANFGLQNDTIAPADFDGDGRTDIAVFRPSDGGWYRLNSSNNTFSAAQFGTGGDLPVPGDFDGDGRADIAVYRPSAGSWYRVNSGSNQFVAVQFGIAEDKPLVADFDADGKTDLAVYRPSNGYWYRINSSTNQFVANQFGIAEDKPVPADYDGDGKADLAVFRPSNNYWYRINSSNTFVFVAVPFGLATDKPAPADYDGDGKADIGVFRPSDGYWYLLRSTLDFHEEHYGANGDLAAPNAFIR
ncbi:MAG: FG-GAP-like repeat-containing protein, partial [Acidobacteriota bacterium]|nr:FG-GAP-like repeat-containing protein [Acidobacteriota bacterium]